MMNVRGIQRNMKNVVKNYSDAQVKVREATSNDPWGPSSTLMSEIADLTYNVVAFSEIMQMIWKRLNDHGKNWRHVYKALVLLEYLIKTGTEKVAQQCKENIFAIQTLKDFQYIEDNKDQGLNVREKSKGLVGLLKDEEKLKNERARALKAKERFAQSVSYVSNSNSMETLPKTSASYHESLTSGLSPGEGQPTAEQPLASDLESARPQTIGEEELQLQLALAMSKEEAEQEDRQRKNDDLRLQLALNESQRKIERAKKSAMDDLLSLNAAVAVQPQSSDPWGGGSLNGGPGSTHGAFGATAGATAATPPSAANDPWSPSPVNITPQNDPWNSQTMRSGSASNDPWQTSPPSGTTPTGVPDPWSSASCDTRSALTSPINEASGGTQMSTSLPSNAGGQMMARKTPEGFLGANSNLVNLDALVSNKIVTGSLPVGGNPFAGVASAGAATGPGAGTASNPFQAAKPPPPTINQLRSQTNFTPGLDSAAGSLPTQPGLEINTQLNVLAAPSSAPSSSYMAPGSNPFAM